MKHINQILTWKQSFGLLPIHLLPTDGYKNSYIMLNGGYGNFCLATQLLNKDTYNYYSFAWSSNTKNFVVINDSNVIIYNWKKEKPEKIQKKQVEDNFEKFYKYLVKDSYKSQDDIVPFIIDIFKQFRNLTQEKTSAIEALNLLFVLLVTIKEDINSIDFKKWGLTNIKIPKNFDCYVDKLKNGFLNIKPDLDLIIRHSSGLLFQEAQKEVLFFDRQMNLWGGFSNKIKSEKKMYSSIHYTPSFLARTIVENAIKELNPNTKNLKIFDPACGSSEFLVEVLKQLKENGYSGHIQIIGWDSSQTAINTSEFLLNYEKRMNWKEKLTYNLALVEDSLKESWADDYDLILMNPPFVSWEQMDKKSRDSVKEVLDKNVKGKPNQASAFFYKAIQSLKEDGIIGCVIPSSFFSLDAYQKLRNEIYDLISINLIGKLGNFVFEDALTDASLIVGCKPKKNIIPFVIWTKNEKGIAQNALRELRKMYYSQSFKVVDKDYSIYKPISFPIAKENWKPISFSENELLKNIERFVYEGNLLRVIDVFNVHQGIRTGNNKAFKFSKAEYIGLPENEKFFFRPVIDNESIKNCKILEKSYVWYPYSEDGLLIKTEDKLTKSVPYFLKNKLAHFRDELINRSRKDKSNWWLLSEHRAWLRKIEPRLVSTEFGNSHSFAVDKRGIFAVERGNAWLPKKTFIRIDYYYFYLAIFSSTFFDKLLSVYSKQLAGGHWYDLGKKYTKDIPIPDVNLSNVRNSLAYSQLVEIGKELSKGNFNIRTISDKILLKSFYHAI
ncbi:SAM-dependent methyltransferase [Desulfonema limicola]|uniref:site-specific DNA-methyltransferase (adenine-specific) n=1 Tax=Desulfonema limicola TaxID=45656 RepID=A0A975B9W4_9BACT|nr:N-6 DNA methylase [Desulfonema limicola]QTA81631.1 SAM-dependent methyltransferase [Desulfonema limicola]